MSLPGEQYPKRAARCGCRTAGRAAIAQWTKDSYGTGLGIDCENAESGPTTANGGLIIPANEFAEADKVLGAVSGETSEDAIVLHFDIRYAVGQAHEQIIERIQAQAEAAGGRIVDILNDDPYYVQADDPRVQLLTATYNDVLGCEARPVLSATAPTPALSRAHSTSVPNSMPTMCRRSTASTWRPAIHRTRCRQRARCR